MFEFTYYKTKAQNSIVNRVLAGSTGLLEVTTQTLTQPANIGSVDAEGYEYLLQYNPIRTADYELNLSLITNYQKNTVASLGDAGDITNGPNVITQGKAKYQYYIAVPVGVNYNPTTGKYVSARLSTEKHDLGSPIPSHTGSFAINFRFLKDFTLYAFSEWGLNNRIYNETQQFVNRLGGNAEYNKYRYLLGLSEAYPGAAPKDLTPLTPKTPEYNAAAEEFARLDGLYPGNYIEDGDYFIIREISLSYDLSEVIKSINLMNYVKYLTAGISVRNVALFSKYSGTDVGLNYAGARTSVSRGQDFLTLQTPRTVNFWFRLGL